MCVAPPAPTALSIAGKSSAAACSYRMVGGEYGRVHLSLSGRAVGAGVEPANNEERIIDMY